MSTSDSGRRIVSMVLGGGILGLTTAWHSLKAGWDTYIIDRNDPFDPRPLMQTSANAIGIIEPPNIKPYKLAQHCYLATRQWYQSLMGEVDFIYPMECTYLTNEDGFLDGAENRAPEENYKELLDPTEKGGFKYGETFYAMMVNTVLYNWWLREQIIQMGGRFHQLEVSDPAHEVTVNGERNPLFVFDCRSDGLRKTPYGGDLFSVSGQTLLCHAPPELGRFTRIIGNPGSRISYNVGFWGDVSQRLIDVLGLEQHLKASDGGQLILLGATKHQDDESWECQPWNDLLIQGCAKVEPRVLKMKPLMERKGKRMKTPEGIKDIRQQYADRIVRILSGWGGVAYCASWEWVRRIVLFEKFSLQTDFNFLRADEYATGT